MKMLNIRSWYEEEEEIEFEENTRLDANCNQDRDNFDEEVDIDKQLFLLAT